MANKKYLQIFSKSSQTIKNAQILFVVLKQFSKLINVS